MKKFWVYLLGILTGVVLTILVSLIFNKSRNPDISYFDEPGEILKAGLFGDNKPVTNLKVFQALGNGFAFAMGDEWYTRDLIVLLCNSEEKPYHDNQSVIAPKGKCFRQIGIYKSGFKTLPIVKLMDK